MPLSALAHQALAGALDLVFAPVCLACEGPIHPSAPERLVCAACWARCRPLPAPRCPRCWNPVDPGRPASPVCTACAPWPAGLRAIRSAYAIGEVPRALVHALKYGGWSALAAPMAARMAPMALPPDVEEEISVVVPVPTGRARLRERGYNQAALLAGEYAARRGLPHRPDLLVRTRSTASQTSLHPGERRANVARAFTTPAGLAGELRGRHVLLVDDVWTTGATALSCAEALRDAGARAVSVATFARAVPELKRS